MHNGATFPVPIFTFLHRPAYENLTNVLLTVCTLRMLATTLVLHSLHICPCWPTNNVSKIICRYVYDPSPYQISPTPSSGLSVFAINPTAGPRVVTLHSAKTFHHINHAKCFKVNHFKLTIVLLLPHTPARHHTVSNDYRNLLVPWGLFQWYVCVYVCIFIIACPITMHNTTCVWSALLVYCLMLVFHCFINIWYL